MDFRGPVSKQMWKMTEIGSGFWETGGTHPPRIPRSTPAGQNFRVGEYNIQNVVSQCEMEYMSTKYSTRWSQCLTNEPF